MALAGSLFPQFPNTQPVSLLPHLLRILFTINSVFKTREENVRAHLKKKRFHEWSLEESAIGALCKGIRILDSRKFLLVDRKLESGKIVLAEYGILGLEFGTLFKASGIPLTIGIQSPSSIDKDWSPVLDSLTLVDDHLGT